MDIGNLDLQASPEDVESRLRAWEKQRPQEIDSGRYKSRFGLFYVEHER